MRLGIDFGTTRTRVAAAINGNYPLIDFFPEDGYHQNWYPSLIGVRGDQVTFWPGCPGGPIRRRMAILSVDQTTAE
jgi:molecular chaperone DnaK (HSP70)